jgi:hypothetical protein
MVGLICTTALPFSSTDSLLMMYFTLARSKLEYTSVALNSVTITGSDKFGSLQKMCSPLLQQIFQNIQYQYDNL